jgi:TonB family protein
MKGQVVDVQPSKDQTPPKESRFLAEHDGTVEKETRSRHARPGYENTLAKPAQPLPGRVAETDPRERAGGAGAPRGPAQQAREERAGSKQDRAAREKLALQLGPRADVAARGERGEAAQRALDGRQRSGEGGQPGTGAENPLAGLQLRPSAEDYARVAGGPAPDKLDGLEEGEGTFLNTRGWKYAGYFNRIKRSLSSTWDPEGAMRARDPTGARFGQHDWLTVLLVKLDERGSLKDVAIQRSSGLDFLDSAAVQAFQRAQPFMNPPRGLADEHGEIVFNFGFSYEIGRGLAGVFGRAPGPQ